MTEVSARIRQALRGAADGRPMDSRKELLGLLQKHPDHPGVHRAMSELMIGFADMRQALYHAQRSAELASADADGWRHFGHVLIMAGLPAPAESALRRGLASDPRHRATREALVGLLLMSGRAVEAEAACREGLVQRPEDPRLTVQLARALMDLARPEEAVTLVERAAAKHRADIDLAETLAVALNYDPRATGEASLEAHELHAELVAARARLSRPTYRGTRDPERTLTVGLLSADLRGHSVGFFIEPLLEHLDRERFGVACYFTGRSEDATSQRLKAMSTVWRACGQMDPGELARTIAGDGVDILIDLSGLSYGHRLAALTARPAPVIATWLGYPNTTGSRAVDYRIVDSRTDPEPAADACATEHLVRLDPCFVCYRAPAAEELPAIEAGPAASGGPVTFGCFNALPKFNDHLFGLWARVLHAAPGSRLVVKNAGLMHPSAREHLAQRMGACGLPMDRVELLAWSRERGEHLGIYNRVDVALDTFPYHGTTTTCEALVMGVPVVTMAGQRHASRVGLSLLAAVGASELAAQDEDGYVALASALAKDPARLASYRSTLRPRVLGSALCDGPAFAARFGGALREMWRGWCGG